MTAIVESDVDSDRLQVQLLQQALAQAASEGCLSTVTNTLLS